MNEFDERGDDDDGIENDRVVQYVDGGMSPAERASFERELAASAELRAEVKSARILRSLVAGLPRKKPVMPSVDVLFERLDAEPQWALGKLLRGLPRQSPPASLRERIFRGLPALTRMRLGRMPAGTMLRLAAAAAVLVASFIALGSAGSPQPPKGPYRFSFERAAQQASPGFDAVKAMRFATTVTTPAESRGSRR